MTEIGTSPVTYIAMLLPRATASAEITAMAQTARKMWFTGLAGSHRIQGIAPQAALTRSCITQCSLAQPVRSLSGSCAVSCW